MSFEEFVSKIKIELPKKKLKITYKKFKAKDKLNYAITMYNSDCYNQIVNMSKAIIKRAKES